MKLLTNYLGSRKLLLFLLLAMLFSCKKTDIQPASETPAEALSTQSQVATAELASNPNLIFEETFEGEAPFSAIRNWDVGDWDYALQYVTNPVFQGVKAARFEIRIDQPLVANGIRSEVTPVYSEDITNNTWYSYSVYFPTVGYEPDTERECINQWKTDGTPATSFRTKSDRFQLETGNTVETREQIDLGPIAKDTWHEFVFHFIHSPNPDGLIEVWHNGVKVLTHQGGNMYPGSLPRWKIGTYKSSWGLSSIVRRVVYYDNIRVGNANATFADMTSGNGEPPPPPPPPPPPGPSSGPTFIAFQSVWRYLDNGTNQGTAWRATSFDDAAWKSGPAQLGYGDGDEATVVSYGPNSSNKYITTYFRKAINIADVTQYTNYNFRVKRDDGVVVYVNGVEVYRNNLPTGTISYTTLASAGASGDGATPVSFTVGASALVTGINVIAVEVHQESASSSDMSFDLELVGSSTSPPPPPTNPPKQVVSFTLVNADTDQDIMQLTQGTTISLAAIGTKNLNIRANTNPATPDAGSVKMKLTGGSSKITVVTVDNKVPFTVFGDNGAGDYLPWTAIPGKYILRGTPYSDSGASTEAINGVEYKINFTIKN